MRACLTMAVACDKGSLLFRLATRDAWFSPSVSLLHALIGLHVLFGTTCGRESLDEAGCLVRWHVSLAVGSAT